MTDFYLDGELIKKIELITDKSQKELYIDGRSQYYMITLQDGTKFKQYPDGSIEEWRE